jgi:hypothetical protein
LLGSVSRWEQPTASRFLKPIAFDRLLRWSLERALASGALVSQLSMEAGSTASATMDTCPVQVWNGLLKTDAGLSLGMLRLNAGLPTFALARRVAIKVTCPAWKKYFTMRL